MATSLQPPLSAPPASSDALFELADAVLCGDGPVRSLAELSLIGEHRRGHGGLYAAVARGRVDTGRLRRALAAVPLPRAADGRLVLAIDITCWLRPDAHTSPLRILCHTYGQGKDQHIPVPGWPYSIICALEPGRSSWTAPLDALRLAPGDDTATSTTRQLRDLLHRLITAGQWQKGDPDVLVIADAGYDAPRLAFGRRHNNKKDPVETKLHTAVRSRNETSLCVRPGWTGRGPSRPLRSGDADTSWRSAAGSSPPRALFAATSSA
ncbi:transposase [Streptomyces sp. NPDC048045]|uniref:transposase n=1 Tax=Streptomyces sp. NPDC048045 TaxID=3154710 RepID=UPI003422F930